MGTKAPRTIVLTSLALIGFAANSLLCRKALGARLIDAASFTALRIGAGAAALVLLCAIAGRGARGTILSGSAGRGGGSWLSAFALFGYAIAFSIAYLRIGAGVGALVLFGAVQITMIGWGLLRGERPTRAEWLGLAIAIGGLTLLTLRGLDAPDLQGIALMAAAGAAWGVYSLRGRRATSPLLVTAGNFSRAVPLALGAGALWFAVAAVHVSLRGALLAIASGGVASGLCYSAWYAALPGLSATRAAILQLCVPVLAAIGGVLLLGESLTARIVVAGTAILGGVALALLGRRRGGRAAAPGSTRSRTPWSKVVVVATALAAIGAGYVGGSLGRAPTGAASPSSGGQHAPSVAAWLRGFDRALALSLRRRHLDLVDAQLAALPRPEAADADPELVAALDEWTQLRRELRDGAGAAELDERLRRLDPDPLRNRVRELGKSGDGAALRALARERGSAAWPPRSIELLARELAAADAGDVASRLLERAIDDHPDDFGLRMTLADLLFLQGPPAAESARIQYGAAQALRPGSIRAAVRHGWLLADQAGDPSAAVALLASAQHRFPEEAVVACAWGSVLFKARFVEEAREKLRIALDLAERGGKALAPVQALALAALSEISLDQKEFERAERASRNSLAVADTPDARDALAESLVGSERAKDALELLEQSVRRFPDDALLRDHLARSLVQAGRFQEGVAQLKEAVHLDEWIAEIQNDYAWELVNSGDPTLWRPGQALEHTQRACEMEPGNSWYRNTLGATHYRLGEFERCVTELEEAAEMPRGGGPYDLFFLAMAKQQLGLHAEALELLGLATAAMPPDNQELVRLQAEAKRVVGAVEGGPP